jgi:hypothetical protein
VSDRKIIRLIKVTFTAKTCCKNMLQKHAALFAVKNFHLSSIQLEYLIARIKGDLIKSLQVALSNSVVLLGERHA